MANQVFKPAFDYVVAKQLENEENGGSVLRCEVIKVGPGRLTEEGRVIPMCLMVGDCVVVPLDVANPLYIDDEEDTVWMFRDREIFGIYSPDPKGCKPCHEGAK